MFFIFYSGIHYTGVSWQEGLSHTSFWNHTSGQYSNIPFLILNISLKREKKGRATFVKAIFLHQPKILCLFKLIFRYPLLNIMMFAPLKKCCEKFSFPPPEVHSVLVRVEIFVAEKRGLKIPHTHNFLTPCSAMCPIDMWNSWFGKFVTLVLIQNDPNRL